jgi:hypothetical protein
VASYPVLGYADERNCLPLLKGDADGHRLKTDIDSMFRPSAWHQLGLPQWHCA